MAQMHERVVVGLTLCSVIDRDRAMRNLGVIMTSHGVGEVIRKPMTPDEPYLICSAGPDIHTAAPGNPGLIHWRVPPSGSGSGDLAKTMQWQATSRPAPDLATTMNWKKTGTSLSPETRDDLISFGLDVVVLGIGVALVIATGGVGALGAWGLVQLATGAAVVTNDALRVNSDINDHGLLDYQEDNPKAKYSSLYKDVAAGAFAVQFVDGKWAANLMKMSIKSLKETGKLSLNIPEIFKIIAPWRDFNETSGTLSEANISIMDSLSGKIGPGQRVKLGKLLDVGGRKAKISAIRAALALKIANDFGASALSLGLSSYNGPLNGLYTDVPAFQFSLMFPNDVGECRIGDERAYDKIPALKSVLNNSFNSSG
ncbi:hypothetical protein AiwAL_14135 [Acidiphilium sp. AL]|uniref:Uncharacterized protein n=1 Tax=Acidiphilium iwatense TaxID=768198 RepID=A0ABS9E0G3_9PROT|nr:MULTISPECIES: hypothetical protein [Acidiphilium]MCF3948502.1 hypothetical protein [Acidiphilium iwatense]MCU4161231.1 hypothetical protein [Acidiphilium sp. AL]